MVEGRPKNVLGEAAQGLSSPDRQEELSERPATGVRQMVLVDERRVMKSTISLLKLIPVYEHVGTTSYGVVSLCARLSAALRPPPPLWSSLS